MSVRAMQERRKAYQAKAGPVSNPGDGRARSVGRRALRRAIARTYLADWDEALTLDTSEAP